METRGRKTTKEAIAIHLEADETKVTSPKERCLAPNKGGCLDHPWGGKDLGKNLKKRPAEKSRKTDPPAPKSASRFLMPCCFVSGKYKQENCSPRVSTNAFWGETQP